MLHRSHLPTFLRCLIAAGCLLILVGLIKPVVAQESETVPAAKEPSRWVEFERDIVPLLQRRCAECHQGDKAKNGFMISDRDTVLGFIEPGSAATSSLWTDYLIAAPKSGTESSLLMPPDGALPRQELAILKMWMDEGAVWPEGAKWAEDPAAVPDTAVTSGSPKWFRALGYFHPAVVHFPIALLSVAAMGVLMSYILGDAYAQFAYRCLVLGFVFAILTAVMGWAFAEARGYGDWSRMITVDATEEQSNIFFHRWLGSAIAVVGLVAVVAGWRAKKGDGTRPGHFWRLCTLCLALLTGVVGHQGGELVYGDLFGKAWEQLSK